MQLVPLAAAQDHSPACQRCGAAARIVPGCTYTAEDRMQFEELCEIVADVDLTPAQAQQLAQETERALFDPSLEKLANRLPGLVPIQSATGRNSEAKRRTLLRLKTIFQALATARRDSVKPAVVLKPGA